MPGCIIGAYGYQRSGKTMLMYLKAEQYRQMGCRVYSNMIVPGWNKLDALTDLPFDFEPKVLLLDEAYFFLDSREFQDNTKATIFFNTIGKTNTLLMVTAVDPGTIEKRIRNQHNYMFIAKKDRNFIHYLALDVVRQTRRIIKLKLDDKLYSLLKYDHKQIPDIVDCKLDGFVEKVRAFNNNQYKNKRSEGRILL
jgi:hypothetical protein